MATHPQLTRLQINHQPSPVPQPLYTPGLPTAIQQTFSMHTPLQSNFGTQIPPHPHPRHGMHRTHPSLMFSGPAAVLAAAGIAPPSGMPVAPIGTPPNLMLGGPGFQRGNRRTPSISTGGPPKAPLGGPNRKHSPISVGQTGGPSTAIQGASEKTKPKKVILKLPLEKVAENQDEGNEDVVYSLWSRLPLAHSLTPKMDLVDPPDVTSMEVHPIEQSTSLPATIDVFLPGKAAWDDYRQKLIEEKLQRLGVERGGNSFLSGQSHIHNRAASISSPADPALLLFKLNKLHQSQTGSIPVSPQPSSLSTSPHPPIPPRFQNGASKHGHSLSLANFTNPPPQQPQFYSPTASFNPFGSGAVLGSDQILGADQATHGPPPHLHAPQGIVPLSLSVQSDTATASSGPSRVASTNPDFNRGFGLDIPEENEEELEAFGKPGNGIAGTLAAEEGDGETDDVEDDSTTAPAHSRHISRVSVALSLKSMGGRNDSLEVKNSTETIDENAPEMNSLVQSLEQPNTGKRNGELDGDSVPGWTGSEDERSVGEYSNPSDEEKALQARQARREAKAHQRSYLEPENTRQLPDFPRPPETETFTRQATSTADDDLVSNPSEEEPTRGLWLYPTHYQSEPAQYQPVIDGQLRSPRPLPPLPHSRSASGNHSLHSALVHSRRGSSIHNEVEPPMVFTGTMSRRDSLNPFAKPFVFGAGVPGGRIGNALQLEPSTAGHSHQKSLGRALNAAAAEFKPTGFTFRPPEGVPSISFSASEASRPLPQVPIGISPLRFQGREKRQRRGSSISQSGDQDEEELSDRETGTSRLIASKLLTNSGNFDNPSMAPPRAISPLPRHKSELNAAALPFKFPITATLTPSIVSKEPATLPFLPIPMQSANYPEMQTQSEPGAAATPDIETKEISSETAASMHPSPSPLRKRPPVLDFRHPISTHTVPAALFRKPLVSSDTEGPTRSSVRSRLDSHEILDHMNNPSLDDTNVQRISRKMSQTRPSRPNMGQDQPIDMFNPVNNGGSDLRGQMLQLPPNSVIPLASESNLPSYLRTRDEIDQIDQRLGDLLDDRMEVLKKDLADTQALATDRLVDLVTTALRTHISESAGQQLNDTAASREVDLELVRNTLQQGVMDIRVVLRSDLEEILRNVEVASILRERQGSNLPLDFQRIMEEFSNRTLSTVTNAVVKFASRIDEIEDFARVRAADDRELLLGELLNTLVPHLESFHHQPVDFDVVTEKLAEAVKPHISQLIDLTSDKKETAGLILQRLMPALSTLPQTPIHIDTDAIVSQIRVEMARMAPASDPHVIKEAVADLVVERLDSRLAVREKSSSSEHLYSRISERIDDLHVPVSDVRKAVENLRMGQDSIMQQSTALNRLHQDTAAQLLTIPEAVKDATTTLQAARNLWTTDHTSNQEMEDVLSRLECIESAVHKLDDHITLQANNLTSLNEGLKSQVSELPRHLGEATASLKETQLEILSRSRSPDQSMEVKNLLVSNAELQVQIAKARGAHGQIRVEKDLMSDRMIAAESERDALRMQLEELKSKGSTTETEVTAAGLRITELEDALSHALARLQAADVTSQAKEERLTTLERQNREMGLEQYQYKSQIQRLELQHEWLTRDKETLEKQLSQHQRDNEVLANQQSHWEELRRTSEQVEQLTRLIGAADSEEVAQLKRDRDRYKVLEGEHASLQKRFKEQETKYLNLDRSTQTAKQRLAQAEQVATERENRVNELEAELDAMRTRLDNAEPARLQLDSDLSLLKKRFEEKVAAEKVAQEREATMRAEVTLLEMQLASLRAGVEEVDRTRRSTAGTGMLATDTAGWRANGYTNGQDARPSSRASTVYGRQSPETPVDTKYRPSRFQPGTPPAAPDSPKGVWGSMHAPRQPSYRAPSTLPYPPRSAIPSPTPSTVSLAPTQGEDGWWS